MLGIAGSAVAFVLKSYRDGRQERRKQFFELMRLLDEPHGPIASKVTAIYQLRFYPEHKEFIIRFCENAQGNLKGSGTEILSAEIEQTLKFLS